MAEAIQTDSLRQAALDHLWMANMDWIRMAEEGDPPIIVEGSGIRVTDSEGRTWIDVNGGLASINVGYGRTEIADAMYDQMTKTAYYAQGSASEPAIRLAEKLAEVTPGDLSRTWLVSGGSEANEIAVRIAKGYHNRRGESGRYKVISRKRSYHGATGGVLWLGGGHAGRFDYEPAPVGTLYAPQPHPYRCELGGQTPSECAQRCAEAVESLIEANDPRSVAAVIAEPIAGAAMVPGGEYWPMLRDICDRHGVLLIADEVVTGFGRTGRWFGVQHWDVEPDIMTLAKGIVSSYAPVGATVASAKVADAFAGGDKFFRAALTAGGHPVTSAAALKNIEIIEDEGLVDNSAEVGAYFLDRLEELREEHPIVGEVRGKGLMLGMELVKDRDSKEDFPPEANLAERFTDRLKAEGLILRPLGSVLSIAPPLCIERSDVDLITAGLDSALGAVERDLDIST